MVHLLRQVLIASLGLATIDKLFLTIRTVQTRAGAGAECITADMRKEEIIKEEVLGAMETSLQALSYTVNTGLAHTASILNLIPPSHFKGPSNRPDIEAISTNEPPEEFAAHLESRLNEFHDGRQQRLNSFLGSRTGHQNSSRTLNQKQLYMVLHIEHLLYCHGNAVLSLVKFADSKLVDGAKATARFITPPAFHLLRWHLHDHGNKDFGLERKEFDGTISKQASNVTSLVMPTDRDVEHLPPTNMWERQSNHLRNVSTFLRSPASVFGFRIACACQCIGVIAFLKKSHHFFTEQRLSWSFLIMALSSSWTSGQSAFSLVIRFVRMIFFGTFINKQLLTRSKLGAFIATLVSLVTWYIVNGHTWGVITIMSIFTILENYFIVKHPRFIVTFITSYVPTA
jgi:hypothetical protein